MNMNYTQTNTSKEDNFETIESGLCADRPGDSKR